jgi:hypothetical protein
LPLFDFAKSRQLKLFQLLKTRQAHKGPAGQALLKTHPIRQNILILERSFERDVPSPVKGQRSWKDRL